MPDNLNPQEISDSIASELLGTGAEAELEPAASPPPPPSLSAQPAPVPSPAEFGLPKAWKKEKEPLWKTLPRDAQEYLTAREADVEKGIGLYSQGHTSWKTLTDPFQELIKANPGVDPVGLFQNLLRNHLALLQSPAEQKRELGLRLLKSYGLEGLLAAEGQPPQNQPPALPPEFLQRQGALEQGLQSLQSAFQARALEEQNKVVSAFAADPKNQYFEEVADDILRLLKTGAADSLPSAYEMAIWANHAVRQKLLQEQIEAARAPAAGKKPPLNLEGAGEGTPKPGKPLSIDDTIAAVVAKHYQH